MKSPSNQTTLLLTILLASPWLLSAEQHFGTPHPPHDASRVPPIRTNADLVLVPVVVTDRGGAAVSVLEAGSFTILENKVPQTIVSFGNQDLPASVGVILDLSGSMRHKLKMAAAAVRAFFDSANADDEAFVLSVSTRPQDVSDFTSDFGLLQNRLLHTKPGGGTALIDTVYLGLSRIRTGQYGRRAILVVSDGMDNYSRYSKGDLLHLVEEADVQIYTIGIAPSPSECKKPIELTEERKGLGLLDNIAERSGGLSFTATSFDDIGPATLKISRAIRNQYVLGYRPVRADNSGKWRAIQVKVSAPQTRVSARRGYYSR